MLALALFCLFAMEKKSHDYLNPFTAVVSCMMTAFLSYCFIKERELKEKRAKNIASLNATHYAIEAMERSGEQLGKFVDERRKIRESTDYEWEKIGIYLGLQFIAPLKKENLDFLVTSHGREILDLVYIIDHTFQELQFLTQKRNHLYSSYIDKGGNVKALSPYERVTLQEYTQRLILNIKNLLEDFKKIKPKIIKFLRAY